MRLYNRFAVVAGIAALLGSVLWWGLRGNAGPRPVVEKPLITSGFTQFATHFTIDSIPGYRILTVRNAWNGNGATMRWLLVDSLPSCPDCTIPDSLLALPRLRIPLRRLVVLSTAQLAMLERLGELDRVIAVGTRDYIYSPAMQKRIDSLHLPCVGNGSGLNMETLITLVPDAVLTFGTGSVQYDDYPRLAKARIPTLLTAEWMESHPLGRLEWLRLLGVLLHRETLADSLVLSSAMRYDSLSGLVRNVHIKRPVVITGYPDGDNWQAGGGQSYQARFLADAGAQYLWASNPEPGQIQLSLEAALTTGTVAEFWLHPSAWQNRAEVLRNEPRVQMLPAWRKGQVFQHSGRIGANGSNDFYESGIVYPERILADLIRILHPGLLDSTELWYYRRLPES